MHATASTPLLADQHTVQKPQHHHQQQQQQQNPAASPKRSPPTSPGHAPTESNSLSAWYHAQRNPYAARSVAVSATLSPLHLQLLAVRKQQQVKGQQRSQQQKLQRERSQRQQQRVETVKDGGLRPPSGESPSLISLVLALFRWCSVIWTRRAGVEQSSV